MPLRQGELGYFDIPYGLASASLTAGKTIVTTTGAGYHGISVIAGSNAKATVTVYDNASDTSGNIIETFIVQADGNVWIDRYIPVKAKKGITVSLTGADVKGAIFFSPKG